MDKLHRFEDYANSIMERLGRAPMRPELIMSRLEHEMEEHLDKEAGCFYAPDLYEVRLHPNDYARLKPFLEELTANLVQHLMEYSSAHKYLLRTYLRVELVPDPHVQAHTLKVMSGTQKPSKSPQWADQYGAAGSTRQLSAVGSSQGPIEATDTIDPSSVPIHLPSAWLTWPRPEFAAEGEAQGGDGQESPPNVLEQGYMIDKSRIQLGRGLNNDIIFDNPHVTRMHARINYENGSYVLYSLHRPLNGTYVNDDPVTDQCVLHHGDVISLGDVKLVFSRGSDNTLDQGDGEAGYTVDYSRGFDQEANSDYVQEYHYGPTSGGSGGWMSTQGRNE